MSEDDKILAMLNYQLSSLTLFFDAPHLNTRFGWDLRSADKYMFEHRIRYTSRNVYSKGR